jgi:hypothetical protein
VGEVAASFGSASRKEQSFCEQLDIDNNLGGVDWRCFRLPLVAGADPRAGQLRAGNAGRIEKMFVAELD